MTAEQNDWRSGQEEIGINVKLTVMIILLKKIIIISEIEIQFTSKKQVLLFLLSIFFTTFEDGRKISNSYMLIK